MKTDNVKSEIVWKGFRLGNIFDFNSSNQLSLNKKGLDISVEKTDIYNIALITQSEKNNGISGYLAENEEISSKKMKNYLTYSMHFGLCFYHDYDFVLMDTHGSVFRLLPRNEVLAKILNSEKAPNYFFSKIITKICNNSIYSYSWLPNSSRVSREIILLPCLEVSENDEYIWEENDRYYTLAVEYIKELMEKAKERKEARTIRMYEAERAKYEAERAKYEAGYNVEKPNVLWKGFRLGNLFERSTKLAIQKNQKELNLSSEKNTTHTVALISASRNDSACAGYIQDDIIDNKKISINKITFDDQWGFTFFQREKFVITGGHNAILEVKNYKLKELLDGNLLLYSFLSSIINKITFKSGLFGYGYKINNKFDREIILLPCLEVSQDDEYIWEENDRYYTLATNYISYLYLTGRINKYQKLIDTYTYMY